MSFSQPNLIFIIKIVVISAIDNVFAAIMGTLDTIIPYVSQKIKPMSVIISIPSERSFVCFVFMVLIDCGKNANVVKNAAVSPIIRAIVSKYLLNRQL